MKSARGVRVFRVPALKGAIQRKRTCVDPTPELTAGPLPATRRGVRIQIVVCGDIRTLRVAGELDLLSRSTLEDTLARLARGGCELVLDLRPLTFMDTTGVHVALAARDLCAVCGCTLRMIPGSVTTQRVFELAGVDRHLPFHSEESDPRIGLPGAGLKDEAAPAGLAAPGEDRAASPQHEPYDTYGQPPVLHPSCPGRPTARLIATGEPPDRETGGALGEPLGFRRSTSSLSRDGASAVRARITRAPRRISSAGFGIASRWAQRATLRYGATGLPHFSRQGEEHLKER